jgi:hypothetical protein
LDLGTLAGPQLCVVIPTSSTFSVIGPGETTKFVWNTAKPMSLGVKPESASYVDASPTTSEFGGHSRRLEHHAPRRTTSGARRGVHALSRPSLQTEKIERR